MEFLLICSIPQRMVFRFHKAVRLALIFQYLAGETICEKGAGLLLVLSSDIIFVFSMQKKRGRDSTRLENNKKENLLLWYYINGSVHVQVRLSFYLVHKLCPTFRNNFQTTEEKETIPVLKSPQQQFSFLAFTVKQVLQPQQFTTHLHWDPTLFTPIRKKLCVRLQLLLGAMMW